MGLYTYCVPLYTVKRYFSAAGYYFFLKILCSTNSTVYYGTYPYDQEYVVRTVVPTVVVR